MILEILCISAFAVSSLLFLVMFLWYALPEMEMGLLKYRPISGEIHWFYIMRLAKKIYHIENNYSNHKKDVIINITKEDEKLLIYVDDILLTKKKFIYMKQNAACSLLFSLTSRLEYLNRYILSLKQEYIDAEAINEKFNW